MIALRLSPELERRLEALAERTGRTASDYVQEAVLEHLDDLEDVYLAEQRLEALEAGKSDTVPLSEIMTRYGLDR